MARYGSPVPSSPGDNLKVALGVGAIGLILFFICLGTFNQGSGGSGGGSGGGGRPRPLAAGKLALVISPSGGSTAIAINREAFDRFVTLAVADDDMGIAAMRLAGQIWLVPSGTECKIIKTGFTACEVRLMDGTYAGQSGFVAREFIKRK